ncbi:MAG: phenylalanine--tRNA ligase subunit beta [Euryarchaeota archaeon]
MRGDIIPTISVQQNLLAELMKSHGLEHDIAILADQLPLMGTDIDNCDEEVLDIEIFPDRPDLLSGETLAFALRPFLHGTKAAPNMNVIEGIIKIDVDSELATIRPVILGAVVRGVNIGTTSAEKDAFIQTLMDHQEKLHFALGRGRKRASIGVHDLAKLQPPFRVLGVDKDYSFTPLAMEQDMTITQILESHPKGIDYAHLMADMERYPIILDSSDKVLSFPPIINGEHTTVTHSTTEFFIDVTGWDRRACQSSLMLIAMQLAEHGGIVESVIINGIDGVDEIVPNGDGINHSVPQRLVNGLLGREFSSDELSTSINRMGGTFSGLSPAPENSPKIPKRMADAAAGEQMLNFIMPRWRFDILHPVDLVEEIAIGHGYEDLGQDVAKAPLTAIPRLDNHIRRRIRDSLQGLGFMQIQSLTLSNDRDQFELMRWQQSGDITRITNPITIDHTLLRQYILPGLFRLLASNRHHELPQGVYELGTVVRDHKNCDRVAFLMAEKGGGFAAVRGRVQAMLRDLGAKEYSIEALPNGEGPWLAGRSAKVIIGDTWVGCFGEIDPAVSNEFELKVPINGAEFDVTLLNSALPDPV